MGRPRASPFSFSFYGTPSFPWRQRWSRWSAAPWWTKRQPWPWQWTCGCRTAFYPYRLPQEQPEGLQERLVRERGQILYRYPSANSSAWIGSGLAGSHCGKGAPVAPIPLAIMSRTSRSMIRPYGPVAVARRRSRFCVFARFFARGEALSPSALTGGGRNGGGYRGGRSFCFWRLGSGCPEQRRPGIKAE